MGKILFCEFCGKILSIHHEGEKLIASCNCGFKKEVESGHTASEKIPEKTIIGEKIIPDSTDGEKCFPHKCKKCGCEEAHVLDIGATYSDESDRILYKCRKCHNVERQADGNSNG